MKFSNITLSSSVILLLLLSGLVFNTQLPMVSAYHGPDHFEHIDSVSQLLDTDNDGKYEDLSITTTLNFNDNYQNYQIDISFNITFIDNEGVIHSPDNSYMSIQRHINVTAGENDISYILPLYTLHNEVQAIEVVNNGSRTIETVIFALHSIHSPDQWKWFYSSIEVAQISYNEIEVEKRAVIDDLVIEYINTTGPRDIDIIRFIAKVTVREEWNYSFGVSLFEVNLTSTDQSMGPNEVIITEMTLIPVGNYTYTFDFNGSFFDELPTNETLSMHTQINMHFENDGDLRTKIGNPYRDQIWYTPEDNNVIIDELEVIDELEDTSVPTDDLTEETTPEVETSATPPKLQLPVYLPVFILSLIVVTYTYRRELRD